ncbi:hypothetical protein V8G54_037421 [Vigna mungo]|uniref:1-deoxy-D-xylulose-5-phosphate reductoisomerase n=1 Tax=Vigna mungo TaxID=3915 RepID=A0AAQ3MIV6_VIGMU
MQRQLETLGAQRDGLEDMLKDMKRKMGPCVCDGIMKKELGFIGNGEAGKDIALANKETLISGGPFVLLLAQKHNVKILPADSEHSVIFQCIQGLPKGSLRRIILTASFRDLPVEKLKDVKVADALKHPNWNMGKKITMDSATLFNKGLEVIEAHYLFGADYDNIEIFIHLQSIIHSMIETQQMGGSKLVYSKGEKDH